MSSCAHEVVTGILRRSSHGLFALETDDGGIWRLDVGWSLRARRLVDRRVTVIGTRADFDLLDVDHLKIA